MAKMRDIPVENSLNPNRLLTTKQVEELFGIPQALLERRRFAGGGPKFFKAGSSRTSIIRYRIRDIEAWIDGHILETTIR